MVNADRDFYIGALLRAYSPKPEGVNTMIDGLAKTTEQLSQAGIHDIQIGVWAEKGNPASDCGLTCNAIWNRLTDFSKLRGFGIHKTEEGDLFVTVLNEGIREQKKRGITHSLILSWEAASFIDQNLVVKIGRAVSDGALAVGVALPEIAEFVCEGAIMNTMALWNINALLEVDGFDPLDTKPRFADHYGASNAGVGEFIPVLKLADKYDQPVLAILYPNKQSAIEVPADRLELQMKKLESKRRRIQGMLATIGKTAEDLKATIMPGYPK